MESLLQQIEGAVTPDTLYSVARAVVIVLAGFVVARVVARAAATAARTTLELPHVELARKGAYYAILTLFLVAAMHQLGFDLSVLLGAAGILTVAVGFASQTAASNLVSGLFLIGERPFQPGDVIEVGGTTGEVLAVDLLACKLRTFDNQFVRLPNELLIKSEVRTLTRYPIRRADLQIGVAYREDLERVRALLLDVADRNPLCLDEPKPLLIFQGFGDSSLNLQLSVWTCKENWLELRTGIQFEIKQAFDDADIEIPFPHRSLYAGSRTDPLPIQVVSGAGDEATAPA